MTNTQANYPETIGIVVNADGDCLPVAFANGNFRPLIGGVWRSFDSFLSWKKGAINYEIKNAWSRLKSK